MTTNTVTQVAAKVIENEQARWGHPIDTVERAAIELVLADRLLSEEAGTSEVRENAAYAVQCRAFSAWWDACKRAVKAINHPEWDEVAVRDSSYGAALSAVRSFEAAHVEVAAA